MALQQPPLEGLADYRLTERTRMVMALARFREAWQGLAEGGSLLKIESPVGLILSDIADELELTSQERHVFLGGRLVNEINSFMETPIAVKLPH